MNKNSYFSDITELFIKAKKEENIEVNPHAKAATREMLSYKIEQIKKSPTTADSTAGSLWNRWKKQLIGVPVSLMAVTLVVFAASNMSVSIPQDDFIPTQELITPIVEEDVAVIEDAQEEPAKVTRKSKPELLTIDYSEKEIPTNQPVITTYYVQPNVPAATPAQPAVQPQETAPAQPATQKKSVTSSQNYESSSRSNGSTSTGGGSSTSGTSSTSTSNTGATSDANTPQTLIQNNNVTQPQTPHLNIPSSDVYGKIDGDFRVDLGENNNPAVEVDPTLNHYRQPLQPQTTTTLTKKELEKSVKLDILSNVNVHYLNSDQAAVEVEENGETRWYMVERSNDNWQVVQKFD